MIDENKRYLGLVPLKREGGIYSEDPTVQKIIDENYQLKTENEKLQAALKRWEDTGLHKDWPITYDKAALGESDD